jgi:hypothetical protein
MKKLLVTMVVLLGFASGLGAKTVELEVFRDWRGSNCTYKSSRPFFTITDIYDLERFWQKADADESMPNIDFDRYMLLVWNPGPSLFDHHPVKVDRFIYKDGRFVVIMDYELKNTGGQWRRPFVATMLPKIKKGDIFIMQKESAGYGRIKWKHVYTLWDMSPGRNMPFEVVKMDEPVKKPAFIDPSKHPKDIPVVTSASVKPAETAGKTETTGSEIASTKGSTATSSGFSDFTSGSSVSKTSVAKSSESKKQADEDFFPDFNSSSGKSAAKTEKKAASPVKATGFDEDPLFGEEFDINF